MKYLQNTVKNKLKANTLTVGSWLNLPSLEVTEIMSRSSFEFLVMDLEHATMSFETVQKMAMVIEGRDVLPFARVEKNDPVVIKKALEAGCYGIIVPMVNTEAEARKAIDGVYYAPQGSRGVGLSRAQGYGLEFGRYKDWYQDNIVLITQVEHIEAVNNLEAILSLDKVDATIIGPYDLSASLGCPGEFEREDVKSAIGTYLKLCKKFNKPAGIHVVSSDAAEVNKRIREGFTFVVFGIDMLFLGNKIGDEMKALTELR